MPCAASRIRKGLSDLVRKLKTEFGVRHFGIWHALQDYWFGVLPDSELGKSYQVTETGGHGLKDPETGTEQRLRRGTVPPASAQRFFHDFHAFLKSQGVDFVKIDNQASEEHFAHDFFSRAETNRAYQDAIQNTAAEFFENGLIHCMSHSNEILFRYHTAAVWRNSDDYYPRKPESHAIHIRNNAFNAVWSHTVALPDWDMFWSEHEAAEFHAAARAISGGPVYVRDEPKNINPDILRRLCTSEGTLLRPLVPALPTPDCLYRDPSSEGRLLKLFTRNQHNQILACFNCHAGEETIADSFSVSDAAPSVTAAEWAVYLSHEQRAFVTDISTSHTVTLSALGWEIATLAPIRDGVTVLGLSNMFNGGGAVLHADWSGEDQFLIRLADGGATIFYSDRAPIDCLAGETSLPVKARGDHFFQIDSPVKGEHEIFLQFGDK